MFNYIPCIIDFISDGKEILFWSSFDETQIFCLPLQILQNHMNYLNKFLRPLPGPWKGPNKINQASWWRKWRCLLLLTTRSQWVSTWKLCSVFPYVGVQSLLWSWPWLRWFDDLIKDMEDINEWVCSYCRLDFGKLLLGADCVFWARIPSRTTVPAWQTHNEWMNGLVLNGYLWRCLLFKVM